MAIYEYIVAFTAILLGLATAKILHALPYVFSKNQRDWTHSFLFVNVMVNQPLTWWATWAYAKVETWTFFTFMLVILMFAFKLFTC